MYGWIQVETVIHKFDSEMGFTTHVVPNMVCSVNDSAYQTLGDVRKRVGWGWFSNQGVWDLVTLGTAVALGATGVGLVASVGIMMAVEAAKAYAKQKLNVPGDGKGSFTSDDDTPGWINNKLDSYNWIEAAVDMKYSTIRDAGALGITRGVKNLSAAKGMSVLQMLGSIKSGTSIAVFGGEGKPSFFKRAQANIAQRATEIAGGMESAAAASKNWAAKSVLSKLTGEAATAFEELTTSKTLTAEQRLAKAKAAAKGYAAMSDEAKLAIQKLTGVTAEAEVIAKLETMLISEAAPTARMATLGKAFGGLKSTGMGLLTKASPILNTAFAFMMVKDVIGLLGSCEKFVVESATKGNMIVVSPLWHRDALMMAGLEGYRNTDAWIHMKGMYLNMKEVFSEAKKGLGEWEPTRLLGDIVSPSLDKTHYLQAQVTNNTAVLNKKGLSAIRDRKNSPTIKKVAALVKNEVNNINAKNKYKIEPELIYAIIEAESGWKGDAENKNKDKKTGQVKSTDRGLMQINSVHGQYSTFDPSINVNYGTSFISRLIDKNNGNIYNALREYNGGQLSKQGPTALAATEAYANKVMLFYNQYKKEGGL
jgi:hypothetical protein